MVDVPRRARQRVPRRDDSAGRTSATTRTGARVAGARLRRRDHAGTSSKTLGNGLRPERRDRPGGRRVDVRQLSPRRQPATQRLHVDSLGRPRSARADRRVLPKPGHAVRLTLDLKLQQAAENALAYGIQLAQAERPVGGARRRDRRARPERRLDPRDGLVADVQAVGLRGARDDEGAREPGADAEDRRRRRTTRRSTARSHGDVSAGLGVQAGHRARRDAGAPRLAVRVSAVHGLLHVAERQVRTRSSTTGTRTSTSRWTCRPRSRTRATRTSTNSVTRSASLPKDRGQPLQQWATRLRLRQAHGLDVGPEAAGLVPTIGSGGRSTSRPAIDKLWKPGDSIQLAIGQGDLLVTPLQMARFYALIANGGKLVTPHVLMDVESPNGTAVPIAERAGAAAGRHRPCGAPGRPQGLFGGHARSASERPTACSGTSPSRSRGRRGRREKVVRSRATSALQNQSWWCGYGPTDDAKLVVCAVIENGGHGGDRRGAGRCSRCSRSSST